MVSSVKSIWAVTESSGGTVVNMSFWEHLFISDIGGPSEANPPPDGTHKSVTVVDDDFDAVVEDV